MSHARIPTKPVIVVGLILSLGGCTTEQGTAAPARATLVPFEKVFVLERRFPLRVPADSPIGLPGPLVVWDDRLALLDQLQANVRVFTFDGQQTMTIGRPGDGPGEFRRPLSAAVVSGDLAVLDANRSAVSFFNRSGAYVGGWEAPLVQPRSLSATPDGKGVLLAARMLGPRQKADSSNAPFALHIVSRGGERLESFGVVPRPSHRYERNFNPVSAAIVGSVVVSVSNASNQVEHYDLTQRRSWVRSLGSPLYQGPDWPERAFSGQGGEQLQLTKWANRQTWSLGILPVDSTRYVVVFSRYDPRTDDRSLYYAVAGLGETPTVTTLPSDVALKVVSAGRALGTLVHDDGSVEVLVYRLALPN